jgi:hypothetical protein
MEKNNKIYHTEIKILFSFKTDFSKVGNNDTAVCRPIAK